MSGATLFITLSLGLLLTPGPTNTLLAVGGAMAGPRRSWLLVPAELAGYMAAIHLLAFVAGPFVQGAPAAQMALRIVLALYLLWLAFSLWRVELGRVELAVKASGAVTPAKIFFVTLLNPKALIFTFVILPPLAEQWRAQLPWLAGLALMIVTASVCWIGLGAAIAGGRLLGGYTRLIPRAGSVVLALFAMVMLAAAVR